MICINSKYVPTLYNVDICTDRNVCNINIDIIIVVNRLRSVIQYFRVNEYEMLPSIAICIHSVIMFCSFLTHLN